MQDDGVGWLYAPRGLADGPLPAHYEPPESPVPNALYPQQQSPSRVVLDDADNLAAVIIAALAARAARRPSPRAAAGVSGTPGTRVS